jgi:GTPase
LGEADILLFVLDARAGVTPEDERFVRVVRKVGKPIILLGNKAEAMKKVEDNLLDSLRLGLGEAVPFSAEHGEGLSMLYDALVPYLPTDENDAQIDAGEKPISIAIMGRPNAGKSTIINSILQEERVLVGAEAGITRDSVAVAFNWKGHALKLIDTAGMRRKSNIIHDLEQMSVQSSLGALKYAQVVVLVLDATIPLEKQDNTIAGLVEKEGRACVIVLNKADMINVDDAYMKAFDYHLSHLVPQMKGIPVIPMVATEAKGIDELMAAILRQHEIWNKRISTNQLNQWLAANIEKHSPPLVNGRRLKFRYITQIKSRPPTFVLFSNKSEKEVPDSYLRYLVNNLRLAFGLEGVPIRLLLRTTKNPYV